MMGERLLILSTLALFASGIHQPLVDSEEPSAASWLEGSWSDKNEPPDEVIRESLGGCICRFRPNKYVVCYGGRRCTSFPRNLTLAPGMVDLRIKTTEMQRLCREDLRNFSALQNLWVDANNNLQEIMPGAFSDMSNLKNLSISYNSDLTYLHPDTFVGLVRLEALRLTKNGFTKIVDVSLSLQARYLPNLNYLSLCENSFPVIDDKAFAALKGTRLQQLELVLCQIMKIKPKALLYFTNLKKLRIGDNLYSEVNLAEVLKELVSHGIFIQLLNLYNSGFRRDGKLTELLETIARLKVSHLILARNHIETITVGLFPLMADLEILDLREVSAVTVEPGALDESLLPKLKTLLLAGNKLSGIVAGVRPPQLAFLDLSENSYSPTSYFDVTASTANITLNLTSLDLSYNRVSTIRGSTFRNFNQLQVLGLKNITLFHVSRRAFSNLSSLKILNLENNPLKPFNQFEFPIFDGLVNLEMLYLGNCRISALSSSLFRNLTNLKYLSLKDNDLIHVDSLLFNPLVSLTGVDLSENRIQPWAIRQFENHTQIRIIILSGNRLHTVTVAMMQDLVGATRVDLSSNAFTCDCWSFNQTKTWLRGDGMYAINSSAVTNMNHLCSAPGSWKEQPLLKFLESDDTCQPVSLKSSITTPVYIFMAVVVGLSIGLGVLAYIYRWYIRYWIFLARMAFLRRHGWFIKKNKVHPGDYKYDVFVSYSHEDRNFIVRLVAMLENQHPFLKLCVYERDFEIGSVISTTVMEKVTTSRRTLLVVSNSFAKSQWCMWELQLAESHRLFFRHSNKEGFQNDPLVMIKLGPIAEANMTPTLKFLLKSRIYLEWNQEAKKQVVFWQKLRATLSPNVERINAKGTPIETTEIT